MNNGTEEVKEVIKEEARMPISLDIDSQAMVAKDNSELIRIIKIMMKGQAFSKTLDTEAKVISAWQVAASFKGISPAKVMQYLCIINGTVCFYGDFIKAVCDATGEVEDYLVYNLNEKQEIISMDNKNLDHEVWAVVVKAKRRGRSLNEYYFTMKDAENAGLLKKQGPWQNYPSTMLLRRTVQKAMRFEFPDALLGAGFAEYDHNVAPDLKDITPRESKLEQITSSLQVDVDRASGE
jgi:hypothetical protein